MVAARGRGVIGHHQSCPTLHPFTTKAPFSIFAPHNLRPHFGGTCAVRALPNLFRSFFVRPRDARDKANVFLQAHSQSDAETHTHKHTMRIALNGNRRFAEAVLRGAWAEDEREKNRAKRSAPG